MIGRILGGVLAACLLLPTGPAAAAPAGGDDPAGAIELEPLDQGFALEPDQPWQATFAMVGDLDRLELATTTTTAATTSSVAPPDSTSTTSAAETTGSSQTRPDTETTTAASPAGSPRVELRVVAHLPIDDRDELAAFLDGDERSGISAVSSPLEPSVTRTGGATELRVDVPTTIAGSGARALQLRRAGLYPVTVQVVADDDVVAEHRTFVERRPAEPSDDEPINIAVLATLPDPPPGTADALTDEQRAEVEALADLSSSYAGPLTVAVPPAVLAGVESQAPALAERLRDALADDDELVSLPAAAFDPSSAVAVDAVETFGDRLADGEAELKAAMPTAPVERSAWITTTVISDGAATMLRNYGFDLLVLDDTTYTGLDGNIGGFLDTTLTVDVELSAGGTVPALVLSPLGALLDPRPSSAGSPVDAAVRILAELVTTRRELGEGQRRSVVLAAPDGRLPDAEVARALSELTGPLDDVRLVPLSTLAATTEPMLVDGAPSTVELPTTAGPDLSARLERIELTRLSTESAASMQLDDDDARRWRSELDALVNTALSDEDANAVLGRIATEAEAVRSSIEAPAPFDFTLTGRSSTLRLNLRNNADEPLLVIVRARSPKLTFPGGDQRVELAPLGATEVTIPVEARSNGTSSIDVDLLTPQFEQPVNGSVLLTAHANALTGLGQVITVGALLVLGSWWFSHHRRQRRDRLIGAAGLAGAEQLDVLSPDAAEVTVGAGVSAADRAPDGGPAAEIGRRP